MATTPARVLVVEDEKKLAELLARGLREEGHAADVAGRGEDALWMARAVPYVASGVVLADGDELDAMAGVEQESLGEARFQHAELLRDAFIALGNTVLHAAREGRLVPEHVAHQRGNMARDPAR